MNMAAIYTILEQILIWKSMESMSQIMKRKGCAKAMQKSYAESDSYLEMTHI